MGEVDDALVGHRRVARARVRGHLCHDRQLAVRVGAGDRQLSRLGGADVQRVRRRPVVDVVHAVPGVDRRQHHAVVRRVEHLRARAASDEELAGRGVDAQAVRAVLAA